MAAVVPLLTIGAETCAALAAHGLALCVHTDGRPYATDICGAACVIMGRDGWYHFAMGKESGPHPSFKAAVMSYSEAINAARDAESPAAP